MACQECGMATRDPGEFHPYAFCVWVKAGLEPWETLEWINSGLGFDMGHLPEPPMIRDLPAIRQAGVRG